MGVTLEHHRGPAPRTVYAGPIELLAATIPPEDLEWMAELYADPDLAEARTALHGAIAVLVSAGVTPDRLQRLVALSMSGFRVAAPSPGSSP